MDSLVGGGVLRSLDRRSDRRCSSSTMCDWALSVLLFSGDPIACWTMSNTDRYSSSMWTFPLGHVDDIRRDRLSVVLDYRR